MGKALEHNDSNVSAKANSNKEELKALIIDDDKWTRTLLGRIIKEYEYVYCEAANPYTGISLAIKEKPTIIFLDIFLPEINGDKILKILKEIDITTQIPVVMVSANFNKELLHDTYTRGAAGFISKPFNRDIVKDVLDKVFQTNGGEPQTANEWIKQL